MHIARLSDAHSVSAQIAPEDVPALVADGVEVVVNNRPDAEVPVELRSDVLRAAVEAAGLRFVDNPFDPRAFSMDLVASQAEALAGGGRSHAYCASGNRCSILWAMSAVQAGEVTPEGAVAACAEAGYDRRDLRPQLDMLAP
ncbi:MAG: beta-lactamase hydrolase domain-containing protein [Paracoccaceae bacterium]